MSESLMLVFVAMGFVVNLFNVIINLTKKK